MDELNGWIWYGKLSKVVSGEKQIYHVIYLFLDWTSYLGIATGRHATIQMEFSYYFIYEVASGSKYVEVQAYS